MTALLAALLLRSEAYELRWRPTEGATTRFRSEVEFQKGGAKTTLESQHTRKVLSVGADGSYTLRSTSAGTLMRTQGQEMRDDRTNSVDLGFGPDGNLTHFLVGKGSAMAARIAGFNSFVAPPKPLGVGQGYRVERAADAGGLASSELAFKLIQASGGVATLEVTFRETSGADRATGSGIWKVDTSTGQPLSLDLTLRDFHTGLGDLVRYRLTQV